MPVSWRLRDAHLQVNDLVKIMENTAQYGFTAEPVDDNIYKWIVNLSGFSEVFRTWA